ncbi:MAG: hypothetical protein Q9191_002332 [Dirinaria sp. TL-2023a]
MYATRTVSEVAAQLTPVTTLGVPMTIQYLAPAQLREQSKDPLGQARIQPQLTAGQASSSTKGSQRTQTSSSLSTISSQLDGSSSVLSITKTYTTDGFITLSQNTMSRHATSPSSSSRQLPSPTPLKSSRSSDTPGKTIIGVVAGVGGAILAVLLIMLWLWLRRKKHAGGGNQASGDEHRIDAFGPQAIGLGTSERISTDMLRTQTPSKLRADQETVFVDLWCGHSLAPSPVLQEPTTAGSIRGYSDGVKVPTEAELAGPMKDVTTELPDTNFKGRAELPTDSERSLINSPKEKPGSPIESVHAESTSSGKSTRGMGSNLNNASEVRRAARAGGSVPHVMSWMSYNEDAGLQR